LSIEKSISKKYEFAGIQLLESLIGRTCYKPDMWFQRAIERLADPAGISGFRVGEGSLA
jgi:hypothetical protein